LCILPKINLHWKTLLPLSPLVTAILSANTGGCIAWELFSMGAGQKKSEEILDTMDSILEFNE
jgi:hypothetical protein